MDLPHCQEQLADSIISRMAMGSISTAGAWSSQLAKLA